MPSTPKFHTGVVTIAAMAGLLFAAFPGAAQGPDLESLQRDGVTVEGEGTGFAKPLVVKGEGIGFATKMKVHGSGTGYATPSRP